MRTENQDRRHLLKLAATAGAAIATTGAGLRAASAADREKEVEANEDLMREHGVLRRALLVYRAAAGRLARDPAGVPAEALAKTARLFRSFEQIADIEARFGLGDIAQFTVAPSPMS
jgi:hypothetical protein